MASFQEINRLAQPAAAWFYAVATDLRDKVAADPDRIEHEYDERSADWDKALEMYDGSTRLRPAAHDRFATYVTMVAEQRPRVAALISEARAAASEPAGVTISEFTTQRGEVPAGDELGKGTAASKQATYYLTVHYKPSATGAPVPTIVWVFLDEAANLRADYRRCIGAVHRDGIEMYEGGINAPGETRRWVRDHAGLPGWQGRTLDGTYARWMAGDTLAEAVASVIARHER